MAERPIFIPSLDGNKLVEIKNIEFNWHKGMAPSQKKKNVIELHSNANKQGVQNILEVSTKSENILGVTLSAFNMKIISDSNHELSLEAVFQGSKVFENGGPFTDLYNKNGYEIKKDERILNSGALIGFDYENTKWELEPKTAFYDWLYLNSLKNIIGIEEDVNEFDAFTDIEFNPKKSFNCQAKSCALFVSLLRRNIFNEVMDDKEKFLDILMSDQGMSEFNDQVNQQRLF